MKQITLQQAAAALLLLSAAGLALARPALPGDSRLMTVAGGGECAPEGTAAQPAEISPLALAKALAGSDPALLLVDIRSAPEYEDYHVPGAVNIPFETLVGPQGPARLKGRRVVLCSGGGGLAEQAQARLTAAGIPAATLRGGLEGWWREIVTPAVLRSDGAALSPDEVRQYEAVRRYFEQRERGETPAPPQEWPADRAPQPGAPEAASEGPHC